MSRDGEGFTVGEAIPETQAETVARLAALPALDYDRVRIAEAGRLGARAPALDKAVAECRGQSGGGKPLQGRALHIEPPEPWPEPVDGADLLTDLSRFYSRHATLPPHGATSLALWSLHTHCYQSARHTPRLAITSTEKGSGKTTVLDLLELTCSKPLPAANLTAAAIFRSIELARPTLLVDEADLFLADAMDVRAVLNAGNKRGGQVVRCVGDDAEPRSFTVHAPAAVAAIGHLPDTLMDRSIRLPMRRATATEKPAPIRARVEQEGAVLARRAARWVADHANRLAEEPAMPDALANRSADNWRVLFAIAEQAGGDWPKLTHDAALASGGGDAGESLGVALLRDVRAIFADAVGIDAMPTAELVRRLTAMEDRPWPELPGTGRPMTATWFNRRVKPYGAERKQWREAGERVWGFDLAGFQDAFARYLPLDVQAPPARTGDVVTLQSGTAHFAKNDLVTPETRHQFGLPENPTKSKVSPRHHLFPGGAGNEGGSRPEATGGNGRWEAEL